MNKLDRYLTKEKDQVTWKDRVADAAGLVILIGMCALLFCVRHGWI